MLIFTCRPFLPKSAPRPFKSPRWLPSCLKMAIWSPTWPTLAPSWLHLGAKLASLAPSWRQDAPQKPSKWRPRCAPNRILGQLGAKRVTEDLKSAPGASIFKDFSLNFEPNSIDFSSSFVQFPAAGSARWRLGARSALDK